MSIKEYLSKLNIDQLKVAINVANELISKKESNGRVKVYIVTTSKKSYWFFDIDKAKSFFIGAAQTEVKSHRPELELSFDFVQVDDLDDYFTAEQISEFMGSEPEIIQG